MVPNPPITGPRMVPAPVATVTELISSPLLPSLAAAAAKGKAAAQVQEAESPCSIRLIIS